MDPIKVMDLVKVPYLRALFFPFSVIFGPFCPKSAFLDPHFSCFRFFPNFDPRVSKQ
jgi:hypothetical protein